MSWDHPRMGGEKLLISFEQVFRQGSPPHGRGKESLLFHCVFLSGITPAWAGKRCS